MQYENRPRNPPADIGVTGLPGPRELPGEEPAALSVHRGLLPSNKAHLVCWRVTREFRQGELSAAQYYKSGWDVPAGEKLQNFKELPELCLTQSTRGAAVRGLAPSPGSTRGAWQAGTAGGPDSGVGPTCQQVLDVSSYQVLHVATATCQEARPGAPCSSHRLGQALPQP